MSHGLDRTRLPRDRDTDDVDEHDEPLVEALRPASFEESGEAGSPLHRRDPGPPVTSRNSWGLPKDWQQAFRTYIQQDQQLSIRLDTFTQRIIKVTGGRKPSNVSSILFDVVWAVMVLSWEAMREGRLQPPQELNVDKGFRKRFEDLHNQFMEVRAGALQEVSNTRELRRDKVWSQKLQTSFEAALERDVFSFLPEKALAPEHQPYFKQALEECLKMAMLRGEGRPPECTNCAALAARLDANKAELAQLWALKSEHDPRPVEAPRPKPKRRQEAEVQTTETSETAQQAALSAELERKATCFSQALQVLGARGEELEAIEAGAENAAEALRERLFATPAVTTSPPAPAASVVNKVPVVAAGNDEALKKQLGEFAKRAKSAEELAAKLQAELDQLAADNAQLKEEAEAWRAAAKLPPAPVLKRSASQTDELPPPPAPRPVSAIVEKIMTAKRPAVSNASCQANIASEEENDKAQLDDLQLSNRKFKEGIKDLEAALAEARGRIKQLEDMCARLRTLIEHLKAKLKEQGVDIAQFDQMLAATGADSFDLKPLLGVFARLWKDAGERLTRQEQREEANSKKIQDLLGAALFKLNPEIVARALQAAAEACGISLGLGEGYGVLPIPVQPQAVAAAAAIAASIGPRGQSPSSPRHAFMYSAGPFMQGPFVSLGRAGAFGESYPTGGGQPTRHMCPACLQVIPPPRGTSELRADSKSQEFGSKLWSARGPNLMGPFSEQAASQEDDQRGQSQKKPLLSALMFGHSEKKRQPAADEEEFPATLAAAGPSASSYGSGQRQRPRSSRPTALQPLPDASSTGEGGIPDSEALPRQRPEVRTWRQRQEGESFAETMRLQRTAAASLPPATVATAAADSSGNAGNTLGGLSAMLRDSKSQPHLAANNNGSSSSSNNNISNNSSSNNSNLNARALPRPASAADIHSSPLWQLTSAAPALDATSQGALRRTRTPTPGRSVRSCDTLSARSTMR
ncbi:unnamed protein product [Polarella glacialis]|uniref:Uncharacterized protein n=1 Tax=Polarella glacialis TaxID=89957 RepID=A0A813H2K5_POLGL|nr:unnamed protein product [Polarella glacialis]